jgi:nicotinamide phosphoribosyltransferase
MSYNENCPIFLSDTYKASHAPQYPPKTTRLASFLESRGGLYPAVRFAGLQAILLRYFSQPITTDDVDEGKAYFSERLPGLFNETGWRHIVADHGGLMPLHIKAVPEGTLVPNHNVLMTIGNTCPQCYWATNYVESVLLHVWYPTTVLTISASIKEVCRKYLVMTSGSDAGLEYMLNDFGFRGASSVETARVGGAAHLMAFPQATDNDPAIRFARKYYGAKVPRGVPAAEHSTITSWGRENEEDAYSNMLYQYPTGPVAVVSDSYNLYRACEVLWGGSLRDAVLRREGVVVIRPDSGHPPTVVLEVLRILGEKFGYATNSFGFAVLNPKVRVIQGDGINEDMIRDILSAMRNAGWAASNIIFGMGGALLQMMNRDTQKFAIKASAIERDGVWQPVYKDPATDPGKKSKAGLLKLVKDEGGFRTVTQDEPGDDYLRLAYFNGTVFTEPWADITARIA